MRNSRIGGENKTSTLSNLKGKPSEYKVNIYVVAISSYVCYGSLAQSFVTQRIYGKSASG